MLLESVPCNYVYLNVVLCMFMFASYGLYVLGQLYMFGGCVHVRLKRSMFFKFVYIYFKCACDC